VPRELTNKYFLSINNCKKKNPSKKSLSDEQNLLKKINLTLEQKPIEELLIKIEVSKLQKKKHIEKKFK